MSEPSMRAVVPPPLPTAASRWNPLVFAPVGVRARLLYIAVGVLISWCWALGTAYLVAGGRWWGAPPQITWVWWVNWVLRVLCVPLSETAIGYAMLVGLTALRVRESLQLWLWAGIWALLHYHYSGNALVVFGPFVVMGVCMIAYKRRSMGEAMVMTAAVHILHNALVDPLQALLRWALG